MTNSIPQRICLLLLFLSIILSIGLPEHVLASESIDIEKINSLQSKVAKGYSSKFCNGIGIGISQEGATRLTISENKESKFNPSLWFELAASGTSNLQKIDKNELAEKISINVIKDCGYAIGLSGQAGIDSFKNYFISIRDEMD
ncbi:hypothetical protein [Prochlorococcus sp. MIT 1307]|uniref:hypothetical protein n=1 Tax=Prochlorococcus sp. MIT 1307 TaxID=3096219 RepID=UPI002A74A679|nr:hypothetical protein [Prochlorococcus sp. MIT 1307]